MWCIHVCISSVLRLIRRKIMGMVSANKRNLYNVTASRIGWAHTQNGACPLVRLLQWYEPQGVLVILKNVHILLFGSYFIVVHEAWK